MTFGHILSFIQDQFANAAHHLSLPRSREFSEIHTNHPFGFHCNTAVSLYFFCWRKWDSLEFTVYAVIMTSSHYHKCGQCLWSFPPFSVCQTSVNVKMCVCVSWPKSSSKVTLSPLWPLKWLTSSLVVDKTNTQSTVSICLLQSASVCVFKIENQMYCCMMVLFTALSFAYYCFLPGSCWLWIESQ